ncbi:hypothetical protein CEXT_333701 [Caerostris extrusa]|uniref:Uncharacterized protein n=1 Tax=Caerostris extrusa TaxID=172846 RepID=A0AAV4XZG9_CAEEX|nr:hypothetical protein CEXT_333701 [Caerostris extrusa]
MTGICKRCGPVRREASEKKIVGRMVEDVVHIQNTIMDVPQEECPGDKRCDKRQTIVLGVRRAQKEDIPSLIQTTSHNNPPFNQPLQAVLKQSGHISSPESPCPREQCLRHPLNRAPLSLCPDSLGCWVVSPGLL